MYQCALTTRMARGRGTAWPNARQAWVYRLSSRAFIGLPCPKNAAGIRCASLIAAPPGSRCPSRSDDSSVAGHAAVDGQGDAADVGRGRAGQEHDDGVDLVLLAHPAEGGRMADELVQRVARDRIGHLAAEVARRHRVDPDPLAARPLLVQVAGQPDDAGLAG